jgi:hypothetical protein
MPEHVIRLRGGWLWYDVEPPADATGVGAGRRISLPISWPEPARSMRTVWLFRSFGAPPLEDPRQGVALRLEQVRGIISARLNGRELARPGPGLDSLEIPLPGGLPPRNTLVLEVDPRGLLPGPGPWGVIALVIRE